jgi:hypothetical protein
MADFEPVDFVPVLSGRHQAFTDEVQSRIGSREILLEGSGNAKRSADVLLFDGPLAHWTKIFFILASMAGGILRML